MTPDNQAPDRRFHQLGRIIAVLELGARAHGEIRWIHLYYALGFIHHASLREPLQKHQQSVPPRLQAKGTGERYRETLDRLATELQEKAGSEQPHHTFDGWASQVLKDLAYGDCVETLLPGRRSRATPSSMPRVIWTSAASCRPTGRQRRQKKSPCSITGTTTWAG